MAGSGLPFKFWNSRSSFFLSSTCSNSCFCSSSKKQTKIENISGGKQQAVCQLPSRTVSCFYDEHVIIIYTENPSGPGTFFCFVLSFLRGAKSQRICLKAKNILKKNTKGIVLFSLNSVRNGFTFASDTWLKVAGLQGFGPKA